jgi:hypothetical protein
VRPVGDSCTRGARATGCCQDGHADTDWMSSLCWARGGGWRCVEVLWRVVFGRGGVSPDSSGRARRGELHLGRRMSLTWARERAALRMGVGRRRVAPGVWDARWESVS